MQHWGPVIHHDGRACPGYLRGRVVEVTLQSASGARARLVEHIGERAMRCPSWDWRNFGEIMVCRETGLPILMFRIVSFRVQQSGAVAKLAAIAANPAPLPDEVMP